MALWTINTDTILRARQLISSNIKTKLPDYVRSDFNPYEAIVPRFRCILLENEVDYPSMARKSALVELFKTNVLPLILELRKRLIKVKRSAKGIENVPKVEGTMIPMDWASDE